MSHCVVRFLLIVLFAVSATMLSACHFSGTAPMNTDHKDPVVELKERPNPQQAYRIEMRIDNAPGPFGMIEGSAQYDVENYIECGKVNRAVGAVSRINTNPPIQWKPLGGNRYEAIVYTDLMVDEDYYGRGVCHWKFTEARARLKATGAETETRFVPAISAEEITAEQSVTWYFWKGGYPLSTPLPSNGRGFPDFGYPSPEDYRPELRDELFSITLTAKEVQP